MNKSTKLLSDMITYMKYAKYDSELKRREVWNEIVDRNKKMHLDKFPELKNDIDDAYAYVYDKKVLPSMRSMQFAGKAIEKHNVKIFNCSYMPIDSLDSFNEAMYLLLNGCGLGLSVQEQHIAKLPELTNLRNHRIKYVIEDSIEGWADSIKVLMSSFLSKTFQPMFIYSKIRPKGSPISTGGKAPGHEPLEICHKNIKKVLSKALNRKGRYGKKEAHLKPIEVLDIICYIADSVRSGGVRRSALITLFSKNDIAVMNAKSGEWWVKNPQRALSNNSVVLNRKTTDHSEFLELWKTIEASGAGEPGVYWTNNVELGTNPCCETSLESNQFCNLTEIYVGDIKNNTEFENRAKAASIIGTLQCSYTDFNYLRENWKNQTDKGALLGVSLTGQASNKDFHNLDIANAAEVVNITNKRIAEKIGVKASERSTVTKPSGCLDPETIIKTNKGELSLSDIFDMNGVDYNTEIGFFNNEEDISVYDKNNELRLIKKLFCNGKQEVYEIKFEDGSIVNATKNHKFLTLDGWKTVLELEESVDIICFN